MKQKKHTTKIVKDTEENKILKIVKQRWASIAGLAIGLGIAVWLNQTGLLNKSFIATPDMAVSRMQWFIVALGCMFLVAFPVLGWFMNTKYEIAKVKNATKHKK